MSNITIRKASLREELKSLQKKAKKTTRLDPITTSTAQADGLLLLGIAINRIAVIQELEDLRREQ